MKKHLWLAPFACALSLAAPFSQPIFAQNAIPDIRDVQPDGKAAKFIVFDVPGNRGYQVATGIDSAGTVVGYYQARKEDVVYGFYRLSNGTIHRFHPSPNVTPDGWAASTAAVSPSGTIIGMFVPEGINRVSYTGFIHDRADHYIEFSPFDAIDTRPQAINSAGVVTGRYEDSAGFYHGFVRDAEGNFTSFDAPGNGPAGQTTPMSINSSGSIVGYTTYYNGSESTEGFLRDSNGNMTVLNPSQSTLVMPVAISDAGEIVGSLVTDYYLGFIRDPQGNYTTFDVQGYATFPVAIDPQGSIIGNFQIGNSAFSFYRLKDGTTRVFTPPGAFTTYATAINANGDITGYFRDASNAQHIFIRINPDPPPPSAAQNGSTSADSAK